MRRQANLDRLGDRRLEAEKEAEVLLSYGW
jgi:hypothetical protein